MERESESLKLAPIARGLILLALSKEAREAPEIPDQVREYECEVCGWKSASIHYNGMCRSCYKSQGE